MNGSKGHLRERCLDEALAIVEEEGLDKLSLREVARRLGVSHQAPYRHFQSRDHILSALVARLYDEFAAFIDDRPTADGPFNDLGKMGARYMEYALTQPLKYRLLFNTALPDYREHPEMLAHARHAFDCLTERLTDMPLRGTKVNSSPDIASDAFFIWSVLHGAASLLHSDAQEALKLSPEDKDALIQHMFDRIGAAIAPNRS